MLTVFMSKQSKSVVNTYSTCRRGWRSGPECRCRTGVMNFDLPTISRACYLSSRQQAVGSTNIPRDWQDTASLMESGMSRWVGAKACTIVC